MTRIRSICFDFGGTLAQQNGRGFCARLAELVPGNEGMLQIFLDKYFRTRCITPLEAEKILFNHFGLVMNERSRSYLFGKHNSICLFNDTIPTLKSLSQYHCGILSNAIEWDITQLDDLGLRQFFSTVLYSFDIGFTKPSIEAFRKYESYIKTLGKIVFVGDSVDKDIKGAMTAGWIPILIDRDCNSQPFRDEYHCIHTLNKLPQLLRKIEND